MVAAADGEHPKQIAGGDQVVATLGVADLTRLLQVIFTTAGVTDANARIVADHLAEAELVGHSSHGVRQIRLYADRLRDGLVDGGAEPSVSLDAGAIVRVAGNRAFGQVAGAYGARLGAARARETGVCVVAVRGAGHFGRNGKWAEIAARERVASFHFGQGIGKPGPVAPFGAREGRLNTNPIAFGLPGDAGDDVILDFSAAEVAGSTAKLAYEKGQALATACIVRPDGTLTSDPAAFVTGGGALIPFGGFKGYGIAIFAEILSGILATEADPVPATNSMLSIYIAIERLMDYARYAGALAELVASIRAAAPMAGVDGVRIPGDRARSVRAARARGGIPLVAAAADMLTGVARDLGIADRLKREWPFIG